MNGIREYYESRLRSPQSPASIRLRNALAKDNQGLARAVAHRMKFDCGMPYEDLFQIGMIGLLKGLERFDPNRGVTLSTFLVPYIQGEVMHHLRDSGSNIKIPRRWRELYARAKRVEQSLSLELGRAPSDQELAERLAIATDRWTLVKGAIHNQCAIPLGDRHEEIAHHEVPVAQPAVDLLREWSRLSQHLGSLPTQERTMIEAVYRQRRPRKALARELRIDSGTLKRRLQQALGGVVAEVIAA